MSILGLNGGRSGIGPGRTLLAEGFVVVSIDYRLAPETKLPEIITDVEDAFKWIRKYGREKFQCRHFQDCRPGWLSRRTSHFHNRLSREAAAHSTGGLLGLWRL